MVHLPDDHPIRDRGPVSEYADPGALEAALCDEHARAVVATVAGGMAHHFNNLLSGVLGLVSLAPTLDPVAMGNLGERLKAQIDHASRLIRVVLTLTRRARSEEGLAQCEAVGQVRDVVALAAVTAAASVTVDAELPEGEVLVPLSAVAVDRLLLLLLTAAIDRVDGAGGVRVTFETAGSECHLVVTADAAPGPPAGTVAEAIGDRCALSCVVARRLAEENGGRLELDEDGPGLCWRLILPIRRLS